MTVQRVPRAVLTATVGVALLAVAGCASSPPPSAAPNETTPVVPSASASPSPSPSGWVRVPVPPQTLSPPPPVNLTLPSIGIDASVVPVGTDADGVLQVPADPWVVGWWSDGVAPGSGTGTVVLDAHLDSHQYGTGPFARATDLAIGDPATLRDDSGRDHRYAVSDVLTYQRTALPVEDLFRQTGPERVVLVTCGGTYRPEAGGWDSNIVVMLEPS